MATPYDDERKPNSFGDAPARHTAFPRNSPDSTRIYGNALGRGGPKQPLDPQAANDRQAISNTLSKAAGMADDAGRAIGDVAMLPIRAAAGALDSTVVRGARAMGAPWPYMSGAMVPDGVDPSSMTPFTDQKRLQSPTLAQAAQAPTSPPAVPTPTSTSTAGAGRGNVNPPLAQPEQRTANGFIGMGLSDPSKTNLNTEAPSPAPAPAAAQTAASVPPASQQPPATPSNNVTRTVGPDGQVSYSGQNVTSAGMTINGQAPGRGGYMEAQRQGVGGLASRAMSDTPRMQAPHIQHSGNSWRAQNDLRNAAVSASSIMNRDANGRMLDTPSTRAYLKALEGDQASRAAADNSQTQAMGANATLAGQGMRNRSDQLVEGMRQTGGLQREAMQQQGGLQREQLQQDGSNSRTLVEAGLKQQELDQKGETQGYANRAAAQIETLRNTVLDPKATEAQRSEAVQMLSTLSGKERGSLKDNFMTVGGGQEWDERANMMRNVPQRLIDLRTNREVGSSQQEGPKEVEIPAGAKPIGFNKQTGQMIVQLANGQQQTIATR